MSLRAVFRSGARNLCVLVAVAMIAGCPNEEPARQATPAGASQADVVSAPTGPNVIVITLDTTRADALGSYGQERATTPNLDRLAGQGTRFLSCTTSAPSTLPSHSSIFTGKHPYAHGVRANSGYVLSDANQTLAEVLGSHGYLTAAEIAAPVIGSHTQIDQGFDLYRDLEFSDITRKTVTYSKAGGEVATELPERDASDITKHAIQFLRTHREEKFFLWLHYFDPHQPYSPPIRYFEEVGGSDYHGEVRYVDDQIGRVLEEIQRLGLGNRTLIVVTADHGEGRGEHSEKTHVFFVYNSTVSVPLLMWGPGIPAGLELQAPVRTIDVAPTILDLLGLPPLDDAQGVSLGPLMLKVPQDLELVGYGESIDPHTVFGTSIIRFVRDGRWKYIHKVNPELYDVVVDPDELNNQASREPKIVRRMQAKLRELIVTAPASPPQSQRPIDAASAAQLEALGYIAATPSGKPDDELSLLELSGVDLNEKVDDIALIAGGLGNLRARDFAGAAEKLRPVVDRNPDRVPTMLKLIDALKGLGEIDERRRLLRRVIALEPDTVDAYVFLAQLTFEAGEAAEAERLLERALRNDPCAVGPRATLAHLAEQKKDYERYVAMLRGGIDDCDPPDELLNNYAYALATTPHGADRDGAEALRIAKQITDGARGNRFDFLDTLAAAYAETGDFENAVAVAKRALALLESSGAPPSATVVAREHLTLFEASRPVRAK